MACRLRSAFQLMCGDFCAQISRLSNDKLLKFFMVNILFERWMEKGTHMTNDT